MLSLCGAIASMYSYHMAQQDILDKTLTIVLMIILYVGHISPYIRIHTYVVHCTPHYLQMLVKLQNNND